MVSTPLNIAKYVYKRRHSLERRKSIHENCVAYPDLSNVKSKDIYKYRVESFLRDCIDYKDALSLMETMYNDNQFDILESTVNYTINNIIPTVESSELPVCIVRIVNLLLAILIKIDLPKQLQILNLLIVLLRITKPLLRDLE